jgi:undecaprenyl pyrophosphate phosphatase UppP
MSLDARIRKFSKSRYRDVFVVLISTIFGIFAGPVVEQIAKPLFSETNILSVAFIIITISIIALRDRKRINSVIG